MNNRINTIKERYGPDCFKRWGSKGANNFWKKYVLIPYGFNAFAITDKQSGKIVNWLNGINPYNS
jgi:hypothetical protein